MRPAWSKPTEVSQQWGNLTVGELTPLLASCSTQETVPCTFQELQVSLPQGYECGKAGTATRLPCGGMRTRERYPSTPLPLTTSSKWETWSWGHEIMRAVPTPHQLQHSEQTLHSKADPDGKGVGKPSPEGARMGELVPPLVCHALTWMKESWPYPSPTAALWRAGLASRLGSTVELDLEEDCM